MIIYISFILKMAAVMRHITIIFENVHAGMTFESYREVEFWSVPCKKDLNHNGFRRHK